VPYTLGWELCEEPTLGSAQADLFHCGPDGESKATVEQLIADVGLRPVWMCGPEEVDIIDGMLRLWFMLVVRRQLGRHLALKMSQE
jgi:predicted dinucleotide-binding enzyme